jgi:hypothetical protein
VNVWSILGQSADPLKLMDCSSTILATADGDEIKQLTASKWLFAFV